MESVAARNALRKKIGIAAMIIVVIHVMLCLYVVFIPAKFSMNNQVINVYKGLFVLGPFFTESRIKSSHYLSVRYKSDGKWSAPRQLVNENFLTFSKKPLRFDKLPFNDYEKRLSYIVGKMAKSKNFEDMKKSSAFRELNQFISEEYIKVPSDSVSLLYGEEGYDPQADSFTLDTVFYFTYNPNAVASVRK